MVLGKLVRKNKFTYYIKYILMSLGVIMIMPVVAYLIDQRWFMFVSIPFLIIMIWVIAIINLESDVDIKAEREAYKMFAKPKLKKEDIRPEGMVEETIKETIIKVRNPFLQEDEIEPPLPQPAEKKDELVEKMKVYKEQTMLIQEAILSVSEQRDELINAHNLKLDGINRKIASLNEQRKQLKEKLLESVDI